MPFRSEKQRKYLWAKHPEIAEKWQREYGSKPWTHRRPGRVFLRLPKKDGKK